MIITPVSAVAGAVVAVAVTVIAGRQQLLDRMLPVFVDFNAALASSKDTMIAVSYMEHGDTNVLSLSKDFPRPIPRDDQVLIQVKASALNPADFKFRRNPVPNFLLPKPKIPGVDLAGVVVEVGSKVTKFQVGDRVAAFFPGFGNQWGAAAEYTAIKSSLLGKIGDSTSFEAACSVPLVGLTTIQALERVPQRSQEGEPLAILIHAGAGGVGTFAIQYCKHVLGMRVATTASSSKAEYLHSLGADVVIDYHTTRFEDVVQHYDVVLDTMSWAYEERTMRRGSTVLKPGTGYYLNILSSDWSLSDSGLEVANGITTVRNIITHYAPFFGHNQSSRRPRYVMTLAKPHGEDVQEVLDLVEQGTIQAVIDKTFPLSEFTDAFKRLEEGHVTGKVVLVH